MASKEDKKQMLKDAKERMKDVTPAANTHFSKDLVNQTVSFDKDDLPKDPVLHLQDNTDCKFTVPDGTTLVKVLIENCNNCTITLANGSTITTSTVEVWKSNGLELVSHIDIGTLQIDMCKDVKIRFGKAEHLTQLVQAGVDTMTLSFVDKPDLDQVSGITELQKTNADLKDGDNISQFITRIVDGKVLTEKIIRLANEFPTTAREQAKHEKDIKAKDAAMTAMAKQMMGMDDKLNEGDKEEIEAKLKETAASRENNAGTIDGDNAQARAEFRRQLGNEQFKIKEYQQAAVHYTESLEAYPDNPAVLCNRSMCWLKLANHKKALADSDACLKLDPNYTKAHFRRGVALLEQDKFVEACKAFRACLDLDPKNAQAKSSMMLAEKKMSMANRQTERD